MKKNKDDLKILLLQIREDEETTLEEYYEFVQLSGLSDHNFTPLNTFIKHEFDPSVIEGFDALFVGGSSDASVMMPDEFPFIESSKKLIRRCYDSNIPVFASCFGFQVAVEEFGGKVILDKPNMEIGTFQIQLTDAAKGDPLYSDTPTPFWAICGHKERAESIPDGATLLAYSELCPYHSFKMENKIFYAFQFHPEVDQKDLIIRITRYQDRYFDGADQLEKLKRTCTHQTPHSNALVKKFVDEFLLK